MDLDQAGPNLIGQLDLDPQFRFTDLKSKHI
jgi:hypothetical protein